MLKEDELEYVHKGKDGYNREESRKTIQERNDKCTKRRAARNKSSETKHDKRIKGIKDTWKEKRQRARGDRAKRMSIHPAEKSCCACGGSAEG